jgi:hypothetical protein
VDNFQIHISAKTSTLNSKPRDAVPYRTLLGSIAGTHVEVTVLPETLLLF